MYRFAYDVAVVGGGLVGAATAREILLRNPALKVAIVEKEKYIAAHQSGHNSGVIHAGIYYVPGSLKAKLCVEGLNLTYKYCYEKRIPYKKCGKLIVAVDPDEVERLDNLYKRAIENNVKDISLLNEAEIKQIEPKVKGIKAIWSPNTGIVDWAKVNQSYIDDCKIMGADVYLNFPVKRLTVHSSTKPVPESQIIINGSSKEIMAKRVITCGGLHSDTLAMMTGCSLEPKIIPFRGEYLTLKPEVSDLIKTNIYPVPNPDLPFLGVHFTPRIDGSVWLGPNAVLAFKREGYKYLDVSFKDIMSFFEYEGFRKLFLNNFSYGLNEMYKGINTFAQVKMLQKYVPSLQFSDVLRGPTGVRAQALSADGKLVDDFVFDTGKGEFSDKVLHVRNAPSPAATSSLAIAKMVVDEAEKKLMFKIS